MVSRTTESTGSTRRAFPQLGELYPFQGRRLEIGGHQIHTLDEGQGEAVVMVHGNPTWSFYYRNVVLALRDRYRDNFIFEKPVIHRRTCFLMAGQRPLITGFP